METRSTNYEALVLLWPTLLATITRCTQSGQMDLCIRNSHLRPTERHAGIHHAYICIKSSSVFTFPMCGRSVASATSQIYFQTFCARQFLFFFSFSSGLSTGHFHLKIQKRRSRSRRRSSEEKKSECQSNNEGLHSNFPWRNK